MDATRTSAIALCVPLSGLWACYLETNPIPDEITEITPLDPSITEVSWTCDADLERWRLDITCIGWTNGGRLYLSEDFVYVEEHKIRSRKAAADGTADELRLDLELASDWREVKPGDSTAFHCNQSPNGLFVIYDREDQIADCRHFGTNNSRWVEVDAVPSCDISWSDTGI